MSEMAERIYDLVRTRRQVSFAELQSQIPGFCYEPTADKKTQVFTFAEHPGLVVWVNLTTEALIALVELRKSKRVYLNPCPALVYLIDGHMLNLPIPKRMPTKETKKDWWVPCVLDLEPVKQGKRQKGKRQEGRG